jgi:hypothetical protein
VAQFMQQSILAHCSNLAEEVPLHQQF